MASGRSRLRAFLQPATAVASHAAASVRGSTSDLALTAAVSSTLRPLSAAFTTRTPSSSTRSSASAPSAAAPGSSSCTASSVWCFLSVVPGFGRYSLAPAPTPASTSATRPSASTAVAAASGSSGCTSVSGWDFFFVVPGFGPYSLAPAPTLARARASTWVRGSSASTTAASPCSWACTTVTAPVRSASPALIAISPFGSGPHLPALATRTTTAVFGGTSTSAYLAVFSSISRRRFSSSAASGEDEPEDTPSDSEPEDASWTYTPPTDAYFIVIGDILKNASFSEPELRYMSDILRERLHKHSKPVGTSLAKKVDKVAQVQVEQSEKIDKLVDAALSKQKKDKQEWTTVNIFGRPLDLPKVGNLVIRMLRSWGP